MPIGHLNAHRSINEIAEVPPLTISPPSSDHSVQRARGQDEWAEGETLLRIFGVAYLLGRGLCVGVASMDYGSRSYDNNLAICPLSAGSRATQGLSNDNLKSLFNTMIVLLGLWSP